MTSYARLMYTMCLVAKSPYNIILERFLLLMNHPQSAQDILLLSWNCLILVKHF